jgi:hypothetical protein
MILRALVAPFVNVPNMVKIFAQNIIKQMPPHQVKFECEAIRI